MRRVVIRHYGAPGVLDVRETPTPVPGKGDVRIAVGAAGVTCDVLHVRRSTFDVRRSTFDDLQLAIIGN